MCCSRGTTWFIVLDVDFTGNAGSADDKVRQWIGCNIGLHPVHHLLPMIPNYILQEAFDAAPVMKTVKVLTLGKSLRSFSLNLWDEKQTKLVSFSSLKAPAPDKRTFETEVSAFDI